MGNAIAIHDTTLLRNRLDNLQCKLDEAYFSSISLEHIAQFLNEPRTYVQKEKEGKEKKIDGKTIYKNFLKIVEIPFRLSRTDAKFCIVDIKMQKFTRPVISALAGSSIGPSVVKGLWFNTFPKTIIKLLKTLCFFVKYYSNIFTDSPIVFPWHAWQITIFIILLNSGQQKASSIHSMDTSFSSTAMIAPFER